MKIFLLKRPIGSNHRRCPLPLVGSRPSGALHPLLHKRAQQTALQLESVIIQGRSHSHHFRMPARIGKIRQVGIQQIELVIRRQTDLPERGQRPTVGQRGIPFLLVIMIVGVHQRLVLVRVGQVMQVIIRIFHVRHQAVPVGHILLERPLRKEIRIPLPVLVRELVAHNRSRVSPFRTIQVRLRPPIAPRQFSIKAPFHPQRIHITVLPHGSGIIPVLLAVGKFVFSRGVQVFRTPRRAHLLRQLPLPQQGRIGQPERTRLESRLDMLQFFSGKHRHPRLQINGTCRTEILGRLENGTLLSVVQGDRLHVVERETSQIDRPVLGIPQLHAIIEHPHMVRAHAPDVDRLQTAHAAIVLYLQTREIPQGICHAVR